MRVCVMSVILAASFSACSGEDTSGLGEEPMNLPYVGKETLAPELEIELVRFLRKAVGTEVRTVRVLKREVASPDDRAGNVRIQVNEDIASEDYKIKIHSENATVLSCSASNWPEIKGMTIEDSISAEEAFGTAVPYLEYYDLSLERDQYRIVLEDLGEDREGSWSIWGKFSHEGRPCRDRGVNVMVSAYSNHVQLFVYKPMEIPVQPTRRISKEQAVKSAEAWTKTLNYFEGKEPRFTGIKMSDIVEVIASPNRKYIREAEAEPPEGEIQSFYCWEVPFAFTDHQHEFRRRLWVNIETGVVIGGG